MAQLYTNQGPTAGLTVFSSPYQAVNDPGSYEAQQIGAGVAEAQTAAGAQVQSAQLAKQAQIAAAQQAAEASKYASNQQLAGIQAQLGYKKNIFGTVFPYFQSQIQSAGSSGTPVAGKPTGYASSIDQLGGGSYGYGGPSAADSSALLSKISNYSPQAVAPPKLPDAPNLPNAPGVQAFKQADLIDPKSMPVISQDLLNQQINSAFASNQRQAATDIQGAQQGTAGRGIGANSPLSRALQAQIQGSTIGANSAAALAAQNNAAQQNAAYAQAMNQALIGQAANVYGTQQGALNAQYGTQVGGLTSEYGTQVGGLTSEYGSQAAAQASMQNAYLQALQGAYGSQLGLQGQLGAARTAANANIYGTNVGYQQAINTANIAAAASRQNALLQSLASFAGG